jgi:hypothetical protein
MKLPILFSAFLAAVISLPALACDLSLVSLATSALRKPVQVAVSVGDDALIARFTVTTPSVNAKQILGPKQFPYMFDVVEVFVTSSESGFPYYEFEVSPYNQTLQVRIVNRTHHREGVDLGLVSSATIVPTGWTAELKIALKPLGIDGDAQKIRGNLYSVLGKQRSYWSAWLPKARRPDFHQPQFFQPLLKCA